MDKFSAELYAGYDPALLEAWRNATVGIAGAGGLGSNAAIALARAGIGKLIIADYDNVSASNLTRQQYFQNQIGLPKVAALQDTLRRINPSTYVSAYPSRVTPVNLDSIFGKATILIEAFDDAGEKEMLIETWQSLFPQRYMIAASGIAGVGKTELIKIEQSGTLFIVGDGVSEVEPGILPISARVAVVANMQANLCLEILAGKRQ